MALDATRDNKIVQDLRDSGVTVKRVKFMSSSKKSLIEDLITPLEKGEITLSADANTLINELEVFEYEQTDTGNVRYHAPSGLYDDCVDALSLAVHLKETQTTVKRRKKRVTGVKMNVMLDRNHR